MISSSELSFRRGEIVTLDTVLPAVRQSKIEIEIETGIKRENGRESVKDFPSFKPLAEVRELTSSLNSGALSEIRIDTKVSRIFYFLSNQYEHASSVFRILAFLENTRFKFRILY
jgi:hypothetical protein